MPEKAGIGNFVSVWSAAPSLFFCKTKEQWRNSVITIANNFFPVFLRVDFNKKSAIFLLLKQNTFSWWVKSKCQWNFSCEMGISNHINFVFSSPCLCQGSPLFELQIMNLSQTDRVPYFAARSATGTMFIKVERRINMKMSRKGNYYGWRAWTYSLWNEGNSVL